MENKINTMPVGLQSFAYILSNQDIWLNNLDREPEKKLGHTIWLTWNKGMA